MTHALLGLQLHSRSTICFQHTAGVTWTAASEPEQQLPSLNVFSAAFH